MGGSQSQESIDYVQRMEFLGKEKVDEREGRKGGNY